MFLLSLRDWNSFKQKAIRNTQIRDNQEIEDSSHFMNTNFLTRKLRIITDSRIFIVCNYVMCVILGVSLFISVTLKLQ